MKDNQSTLKNKQKEELTQKNKTTPTKTNQGKFASQTDKRKQTTQNNKSPKIENVFEGDLGIENNYEGNFEDNYEEDTDLDENSENQKYKTQLPKAKFKTDLNKKQKSN